MVDYRFMRNRRREESPSRRATGNIEVDPALAQQLVLAACQYDEPSQAYVCPDCEGAAATAKAIEHDDDCRMGHLFKRAAVRLEEETG